MNFIRQHGIFEPKEQKLRITIVGAGSTGSFMALALAKLGYRNVKVIDFDRVEEHNVPVQIYKPSNQGDLKVDALNSIVNDFTGEGLRVENRKVDENYEFGFDYTQENLVVVCVDSMEARKIIWNKCRGQGVMLVDTRMGGEGYSIQVVNCNKVDEYWRNYESSLNVKTKDLPCGQHAVVYAIMSLVAETTNIIKRIDKRQDYVKLLKREMGGYKILSS